MFEAVFDRPMTPAHWAWKLARDDDPVPHVWLAVDDADCPIGQYAGIPRQVRLEGRDYRIMVAVDAMTHPRFRGRGVLTRMVREAHAAWRSAGVAFVLGMPNEQWGSRRAALGWQPVTSLRWFVTPLNVEAVLARQMGWAGRFTRTPLSTLWSRWWDAPPLPGCRVREVVGGDALAAFEGQAAQDPADRRARLNRDAPWMTRRLLERPQSPYRVLVAYQGQEACGYSACQIQHVGARRVGTLTELALGEPHAEVGRWLLRETLRRLRADGADSVLALAVPGTADDAMLRRAGFVFTRGTFSVQAVTLDERVSVQTLQRMEWILRGSDFDLI